MWTSRLTLPAAALKGHSEFALSVLEVMSGVRVENDSIHLNALMFQQQEGWREAV